ncbi:SpoIIE family protein phosphatase [Kineococcus radiotolerans]|uniref:GAF sensor protein n=1 Tax=Kineococcus radiotolerans (strain ATCC BAA-149 / DSM 14245 / SRS30216) TaxID=266940 RepID=A6W9I3_KINRD|nr:SpoIIE family protein phosphatase [Kineococcus radiotolerans]ABS03472.1 putative GAF sensor protein [Kineococcus radiotolerans SRS30216 = ATCC BAA-149]
MATGASMQPGSFTPGYGAVDLTTCEREPIHIPGAIQPHGVLLAVERGDHRVVVASANAAGFFGRPLPEVLSSSLADLLGADLTERVRGADLLDNLDEVLHARLPGPGGSAGADAVEADVVLHVSGERLVVEIEPSPPHTAPVSYRATRGAIARLAGTRGIEGLCERLVREVRVLTGFDRVMAYRFDAQWNGEVIAEDRREDLDTFLGLHYPASDIPAQARRLYTLNWMRLIADVDYVPSPLHPLLDPGTGAPLDLSHSVLRSVSPIHVEYLKNMGVGASMSISLIVEGRLWGLVACHHYSGAHRPGYDAQSAAEFLSQTASQLIGERARSQERDGALAAQELLSDITAAVSASGREPLTTLIEEPRLLQLLDAGGAALWTGHELLTSGQVPPSAQLRRIAALLARADGAPTFTDHLPTLDPGLAEVAQTAAGALRVGIDGTGWLLWLRPERPRLLDWSGDPHHAEITRVEGLEVRISPRKSFEKWSEVVRGRSTTWRSWHAATADRLRTQVTGIMLGRSRGQIAIAESLQRAVVLDEAPHVPGVEVLARYRPAEGSQLGGDWWDVLPLEAGRVAIVVGDVAGHGVHAAAAMAQLRTALRAYLLEGHSPASALDRLDTLVSTLLGNHTATALIAVVHPAGDHADGGGVDPGRDPGPRVDDGAATIELASAGHLPPLLVDAAGTSVVHVPSRPMLGLGFGPTAGLVSESVRAPLPPGAVLLMYTDGLVERRDAGLEETTGVLAETATRAAADLLPRSRGGMAAVADRLLTAVPGDAGDDTTLVLVRPAHPAAEPAARTEG